jgi:hypothetical protein
MYGAGVVLEANKHPVVRVIEKGKTGALVSAVEELVDALSARAVLVPWHSLLPK